jgi:hypothetical protein
MNKVVITIIIIILFFANSFAKLPENPGISVIDGATGTLGNSPMICAIFNLDTNKLVLEAGGISYYDTPILGEERIVTYFCGALMSIKENRFSFSATSLSALEMYSETDICASYGLTFAKIFHIGITADYLILQSEGDYIFGANANVSAGIGNNAILGVFSYKVDNITRNEYNPTIQSVKMTIRAKENRFGSQGVSLKIDNYLRKITTELIYGFSITDNVALGVSFIPKPFVIKFGFVFSAKPIKTGAAFSLHNVLGLSKYFFVQYLPE